MRVFCANRRRTGRFGHEYYRCGPAICGRFSWFKASHASDGAPLVDRKNPDPNKQKRPLCGMEFVTGLMPARDGTWTSGKIYSAGTGGFYDLDITKVEPNRLTERGYKGMRLFGKTFTLTRAPADLPRCKP
ncbi:DUF2147 domain-containing protein [Sphingomonas psychrolutea]|nr:DUF2147 domain-containing protein [Sphingomonas psychrolutea]